ncbi:aspartate kinase [Streptococcus pseudoporcinus]|uniref:Aspartokinase n=1 Tax=Streptococcus pseudoporcinus TaxID=361101 RepID=A0A4U9XHF5_9STRE|nr:aspartate kinase [Streptococcus pseudoporcinus]VTS12584.1 aspartate kinase [Streptococcus pseudoporcinus]VUC65166.1 aspartate kinase [Streptococcus pseudoporcinus]VUC95938.1 aspartate kinase [Streptococcus pseudoporcinus]VUC96330.1 aspartate kinase [Streptococcus pseudoporcinus]
MKVTKFGGSSLANAEQLKKVLNIVKTDADRKFIVVSAPGKEHSDDQKLTDILIAYHDAYVTGAPLNDIQDSIINRFKTIIESLELSQKLLDTITNNIKGLAQLPIENNPFLYDAFLASGEDNNAKLIAEYFRNNGIKARYLNPGVAGLMVSSEPQNARILPASYDKMEKLKEYDGILVIPGFFGITKDGQICTFSRGGSDITGSLIAAAISADLYENFTDVDGIFAAHPGVVKKPHSIKELTYKEMRELAYAGFTVLHDEALIPAYRGRVPLVIKNTNNPDHPGTKIVLDRSTDKNPVVGISGDDRFISINMSKYLMNREVGFGRKVLQILEDLHIRWEHMPTGIDDLSIVIREREMTPIKEKEILTYLTHNLEVDEVSVTKNLSIIMIVGENMKSHVGVTAAATKALSENKINITMISQGSSEVSVMFVVDSKDEKKAIKALYQAFFN